MADVIMHHVTPDGKRLALHPKSNAKNISVVPTEVMPEGVKNVEEVLNELGSLAFEDSIDIPAASTTEAGVVQLSSDTDNEEAETTAATTAAVSKVAKEAVHLTGDQDVAGVKNFNDGIKIGGNAQLSYSTDEAGNKVVTLDVL